MAPTLPQFNVARFRSYIFRLPLFTRLIMFLIVLLWVLSLQGLWNVKQWGALIPRELSLTSLYRTNTYPLVHAGFLHMFWNLLAVTPLMSGFEAEHGTLTSLSLFIGPLSLIPALLYTFIEAGIFQGNAPVLGASIWVFMLLAMEAVKTYRSNPYFMLGDTRIPTWTTPLVLLLFVTILIPNTSLLGHLCGMSIGYLWGFGFLKFLAPPEWALRYIEGKMNLLGRLPHYVSVDQKTYGRYGVLPTVSGPPPVEMGSPATYITSSQRLGP